MGSPLFRKECLGVVLIIGFVFLGVNVVRAQEVAQPSKAEEVQAEEAKPEIEWIWGEVVSIDNAANKLVVKSLDYETYEEKEVAVDVNDKTTYENIASLLDIKPGDSVSVDYIVSEEGNNLAKNISVEKPEPEEGK